MLEFYKSDEARRAAESNDLWSNAVRPIMVGNTRKFLHEASEEDIRLFESVAGNVLTALGYDLERIPRGARRMVSEEDIGRFEAENRRLKEQALRHTDVENLMRLDRQTTLVHEIRLRGQMAPSSMRAIV
jgi:hypothetical protein